MTHTASRAGSALLALLTGALPLFGLVETPQRPWLLQERLEDGRLRLSLQQEVPEERTDFQLLEWDCDHMVAQAMPADTAALVRDHLS